MAKRTRGKAQHTSRPVAPVKRKAKANQAATAVQTTGSEDYLSFLEDYRYVYQDLKTILLISLIMVVIMVGLSFVL